VVVVRGEIDMAVEDRFTAALRDAVSRADGGLVVVDLTQTSFLDSTGIRALVDGLHAANAAGTGFRVVGVSGMVRRVLEVTGVSRRWSIPKLIKTGRVGHYRGDDRSGGGGPAV
jgi:anti-anti-sigma factor